MKRLEGISASNGIAIAPVYKIVTPDLSFKKRRVVKTSAEIKRFMVALRKSLADLKVIKANVLRNLGNQNAHIFQSHIDVLTNNRFTDAVKRQIQYDKLNAEWALETIAKNMIRALVNNHHNLNGNHMIIKAAKLKINFIRDVTKRILSHLLGHRLPNLALINRPVIIVAHDLLPSDMAQLNTNYVKGAVADLGGKTAHSAIIAKTLKMPAVVGIKGITNYVSANDLLAVDGAKGTVIINPNPSQIKRYRRKLKNYSFKLKHLNYLKKSPTVSADGVPMRIAANVNNFRDIAPANDVGAEGIGLCRTEFLFMNFSHLPSENEQFHVYKRIVLQAKNHSVTFRTLDVGGDKRIAYLKQPRERNPFLGYRGIRFCLDHTKLFRTQLRALLRASAYGKISIIFPLISTIQEFRDAKTILEEERRRLIQHGILVGQIKVGLMIETPAAALMADKLTKLADVVNVGTNDLIQFMMAADRGNNLVANLYLPFDPSVIRMIQLIVSCCHRNQTSVCVCGEMAASSIAIPLLLGMGVNQLSMNSVSILKSRSLVKKLRVARMRKLVNQVVHQATDEIEVVRMVRKLIGNCF